MTDTNEPKQADRNRPTMAPGGCECSKCGCIFIGGETHTECGICANEPKQAPAVEAGARDERAWEDYLDEQKRILGMPGFRARPCFIAGYQAAQAADVGREYAPYGFHCRVARLLAELHGEEVLSEQQCAKIFGVDLVSWREIEYTFSRDSWLTEGEAADLSGPTTEGAIRAALTRAKEQK